MEPEVSPTPNAPAARRTPSDQSRPMVGRLARAVDSQIQEAALSSERLIAYVRLAAAALIACVDLINYIDHGSNFPAVTVGFACVAGLIVALLRARLFLRSFPIFLPVLDTAVLVAAHVFSIHEHGQDEFFRQFGMTNVALACGLLAVSGGLRLRPIIALEATILGIGAYLAVVAAIGIPGPDFIFVDIALITACGLFGQYASNFVRRALRLERVLLSVFDASPVGLAVVDPDGRLIQVNRVFRRKFGYGSDDAGGTRTGAILTDGPGKPIAAPRVWELFIDATEADQIRTAVNDADITGLGNLDRRAHWRTADGRRRVVDWSVSLILGAGPAAGSFVIAADDVTDFVSAEAAVHHASKMALLGRMSAGVAHEIGNPLSSMAMLVQMLRNPPDKNTHDEIVGEIDGIVKRLADIMSTIRTFSRAAPPKFGPVDVRNLIDDVVGMLRLHRQGRQMKIRVDAPADLPTIPGAEGQLHQVLLNIGLNACEAMTAGSELLFAADVRGKELILRVRDSGPGISPEHVPAIFDPFFTTKATGTGLGLAISFNHIQAHGGKLEVESTGPDGTTFAIHLPL